MLTKSEKFVLEFINEKYTAGEVVDTYNIREQSGIDPHTFDMICVNLAKKGYFEEFINNDTLASYNFITTYKSSNYRETERLEERDFIIKSIAIPIIVGILSSIITAAIIAIYS